MPQRKPFWMIVICIATLALAGCQHYKNVPQGVTNDTSMDVDEAMEIRDWSPSIAYYENPRFIAGPTGFWFQSQYDRPEYQYYFIESPLFVAQTLMLPITLIFDPPWKQVVYAGETVQSTYTAMPPLPPMFSEPPVPESPMGPVREPGPVTPMPPLGIQSTPEPPVTPRELPVPPRVEPRIERPVPTPEARPSTIPPAERPRSMMPPPQPVTRPTTMPPSVQRTTPVLPPTTAPATRPARQDFDTRPSSTGRATPALPPATQPTTFPSRPDLSK